eukprot:14261-Heterococcus_DN1.PRE.1
MFCKNEGDSPNTPAVCQLETWHQQDGPATASDSVSDVANQLKLLKWHCYCCLLLALVAAPIAVGSLLAVVAVNRRDARMCMFNVASKCCDRQCKSSTARTASSSNAARCAYYRPHSVVASTHYSPVELAAPLLSVSGSSALCRFSVPAFKKSAKPLWKALRAAGSWSSAELSCSRSVAGLPA